MKKYTIKQFNAQFPDDDACLEYLKNARWPDGITCERCQRVTKHYRISGRKVYSCEFCGSHVSPTADTIFHKSDTSLRSWFYAMFLMASTRTGISAKQLERELGVTYKTAWRMFTYIRKLMRQDGAALFGKVEVDESYIGGKAKWMHKSKRTGKRGRGAQSKTVAVALVERKGRAVVKVTGDVKAKTILPIIRQHIPIKGTTTIFTDELPTYDRLTGMGYAHERVQHAAKVYVSSEAHVNNVESLWSHIKRGISGVHHSVSPKHLQSYLDSYVFRFNHRQDEAPMFETLLGRLPSTQVLGQ